MTTGTEIEVRQQSGSANLPAKVLYAKALADSGLLPAAYRRQPANVLYAIEYGDMLGLSPMAAITGVHIIEGKPTASAALISALVRRAGHKLRVRGDAKSAWCQIIRCDDPDFPFEVTFTIEDAKTAGLTGKKVWQQYGSSMLKSRAITQCARDACEEALFGLHYTPEELGAEVDEDGVVVAEVVDEPAQPAQPRPVSETEAAPAVDPVAEPARDDPWLKGALKAAGNLSAVEACEAMSLKADERLADGRLDKAAYADLQTILLSRMAALKGEPEPAAPSAAAVLDPDDPWAVAIRELVDAGAAEMLLGDARDQAERTELSPDRLALIEQAVEELFPGITTTEAEAA